MHDCPIDNKTTSGAAGDHVSWGDQRCQRHITALVVVIDLLTRGTGVIVVAVDMVIEQSVPVLASAGGALRRRSSALVVVIEHLPRLTGIGRRVVSVASVVAVEMLARVTGISRRVVFVTSVVAVEMLASVAGVGRRVVVVAGAGEYCVDVSVLAVVECARPRPAGSVDPVLTCRAT